ncbi:MAG: IPT/TIG domain-containing protein [Verrucomicrobia bacterium]|nr:IPT/TIG domain-containing protein [Verrucomicrobiota bacterium]
MQNNRFSHARRIFLTISAALGLFLLAGCEVPIVNLTPSVIPENPSQIYTISARVNPQVPNLVPGSLLVRIIIDGQSFPMKKSDLGANIYEFDYQLPAGRSEIAYYYLVNYKFEHDSIVSSREEYSDVIHAKIIGRYVLSLEVNRGPVGARVSILGRGFTAQDTVTFDGTSARTVFESPNAISFFVPAVEPNRNYKVEIAGANGVSSVGTFRVDPTALAVSPTELSLKHGETQTLTFTLPTPAPTGGLLLDVTTDAPESVIMPEVVVPAGSSSATVNVTGGKPGSGSLFLKGFGSGEITVPVTVK